MVKNVRVASLSFSGTGGTFGAKETVRRNLEVMSKLLEKVL